MHPSDQPGAGETPSADKYPTVYSCPLSGEELESSIQQLVEECVELCVRLNCSVAVAESLTGGMLSSAFVSVPGVSAVFRGGIISYATDLKAQLLGVSPQQLDRTGPVAAHVATEMAAGVRRACGQDGAHVDFGVSTTGVAGPGVDAVSGAPAGTVFCAVASSRGSASRQYFFEGTRLQIRTQSCWAALTQFKQALRAFENELVS